MAGKLLDKWQSMGTKGQTLKNESLTRNHFYFYNETEIQFKICQIVFLQIVKMKPGLFLNFENMQLFLPTGRDIVGKMIDFCRETNSC